MSEILELIEKNADFFRQTAPDCEAAGKLTQEVADKLREIGVIRMTQPIEFGGSESTPREFFEAVIEIGSKNGAAGWIASVVGIHTWELAQFHHDIQEQVWGGGPDSPYGKDTWIASPYAPTGKGVPENGGYRVNGRWQFSSGSDHCQWDFLGGVLLDEQGKVDKTVHFIFKRPEWEVVEGTWDVIGLEGTGSKDVVVENVWIAPDRIVYPDQLLENALALGRTNPLYRMPFATMFSGAITAGSLAIAKGALGAFIDYTRGRVDARGAKVATSPHQLAVLGAASSDIDASILQFLTDLDRVHEVAAREEEIPLGLRIEVRRNQVRAVRRAMDAVDQLFMHAGGGSLRHSQPFQRFWRDMHAAMNHISNAAELTYEGYGSHLFGGEIPDGVRF